MDLIVRLNDSIRLQEGNNDSFADVSISESQRVISICFYKNHRLRLIQKDHTFKMFVIPKSINPQNFDCGWWSDGQLVWKSN